MNTRREFIAGVTAAAGAVFLPGHLWGAKSDSSSYSFALLGDTHFDAPDKGVYHAKLFALPNVPHFARNEIPAYCEMWEERLPSLVSAGAAVAKKQRAKFLVHVGDLAHGDCGDGTAHRRMLGDALACLGRAYGDMPIYLAAGNHDVRGVGAGTAYLDFAKNELAKAARQTLRSSEYVVTFGPDAFVFLDFNRISFKSAIGLLDSAKGARNLFVVDHGPVLPSDSWFPYWIPFGNQHGKTTPELDAGRRKFLGELIAREAIVLGGHTHQIDFKEYENGDGRLVQLLMNSVWTKERQGTNPDCLDKNPSTYMNWLKEPKHKAKPSELAMLEEYRPGLKRYERYAGAGHALVEVRGRSVKASVCVGASQKPLVTYVLRG